MPASLTFTHPFISENISPLENSLLLSGSFVITPLSGAVTFCVEFACINDPTTPFALKSPSVYSWVPLDFRLASLILSSGVFIGSDDIIVSFLSKTNERFPRYIPYVSASFEPIDNVFPRFIFATALVIASPLGDRLALIVPSAEVLIYPISSDFLSVSSDSSL